MFSSKLQELNTFDEGDFPLKQKKYFIENDAPGFVYIGICIVFVNKKNGKIAAIYDDNDNYASLYSSKIIEYNRSSNEINDCINKILEQYDCDIRQIEFIGTLREEHDSNKIYITYKISLNNMNIVSHYNKKINWLNFKKIYDNYNIFNYKSKVIINYVFENECEKLIKKGDSFKND